MRDTLYLFPGLLCDARVWEHQSEHLSDLVEVRIPSFRDYKSFDAMADSVLAEAPARFFVAGHSMGARIAMQTLKKAPERVKKLALLDSGVHAKTEGEEAKRQVLIDLANEKGMAEVARTWGPPMVHPDRHDDAIMQEIYDMVENYSVESFQNQITALLTREYAAPILSKAPAGTLVLCGREDLWSPPAQHEEIAKALPDHPEVVVIEDCGHMSTMEQPEAVTAAMRKWLEVS